MSHLSSLVRRASSVPSILCLLSAGVTASQNPITKLFGADKTNYQSFKDPSGRFQLDYPSKDWKRLPIGGSSLAVFVHKDGPTLVVDQLKLEEALTPGEVAALPGVEVENLRTQQPNVKEFKPDMFDGQAGRGVLIRYTRVGSEPESVIQFSVPVGRDLYRLNGVVADKLLSKLEPVILHMIQSFKAPADPGGAKN